MMYHCMKRARAAQQKFHRDCAICGLGLLSIVGLALAIG